MEVRRCSGMVQMWILSSTGVNSPSLACAVTPVFLCSPQMPWNSVTQTAASIWVHFPASLDFLDLKSSPLKQLGLVIRKNGLTYLLSEHIASVRAGARHSFALDQSQRQTLAVESSVNGIISKKTECSTWALQMVSLDKELIRRTPQGSVLALVFFNTLVMVWTGTWAVSLLEYHSYSREAT